ncbi:glycosyltransferase family 4 protein [Bdellovibrio sp. KM01]|uniref:glycosyltransferase family 4 protein n=1 Tax=Bdellovibrio sp. KM01 TaxID=2748865 RepID=UPI0015E97024|nr:glycosyltransferase family 4 protein [Bdellovibrio sp. KM01]QLY23876.1 glycosyltransferase family 4 protein [Bdellovibrio sp. KM01]
MKPVRLLHAIHSFSWGGLELYSTELIIKLQATHVEQWVLCFEGSRIAKELKAAGVRTIETTGKKISKLNEAGLIRGAIRKHDITHLHSHTRIDMWAACVARWFNKDIKHVYNLYMNAIPKRDFVHRALFRRVDALCSSSEDILKDVKRNFPIDPSKLKLVRYGRDTDRFVPSPALREQIREKFAVQKDQMVIGTLCRIDAGKGVRELVESLDYLPDEDLKNVQIWVIGDRTVLGQSDKGEVIYEPESQALYDWMLARAQSDRLKNHLHHISFQREYIPYIDALDIFALASYNETYSLSVIDAMMMGKPVIGTNAGGTPEQVGGSERGVLAEPRSGQALADCIRYYLMHPDKALKHGEKGRDWALHNHNWPNTLKHFIELYQKL